MRFYADFDEDTQFWCVFDDQTGKALSSWCDPETAEAEAKKLNDADV